MVIYGNLLTSKRTFWSTTNKTLPNNNEKIMEQWRKHDLTNNFISKLVKPRKWKIEPLLTYCSTLWRHRRLRRCFREPLSSTCFAATLVWTSTSRAMTVSSEARWPARRRACMTTSVVSFRRARSRQVRLQSVRTVLLTTSTRNEGWRRAFRSKSDTINTCIRTYVQFIDL